MYMYTMYTMYIRSPDRKRQTQVCHINMMKPYIVRDGGKAND